MKRKKQFVTPRVVKEFSVQLERGILVDSAGFTVSSMGQDLEVIDFKPAEAGQPENEYDVFWN
jgi:hypothetical protein